MEIRQLQYFQMVCKFNSITRAAEQLHLAQPSVTVGIKKLENELGLLLFDRNQKQITLTTEGKIFLQRVDIILRSIEDTIIEMNDFKNFQKGKIKIGIPPMIGAFLFPKIFSDFKKIYPQLELNIFEEGSLGIRSLLEKGDIDLGIIILSHSSDLLEAINITKGKILLCLPNNHKFCSLPSVPFSSLRNEPFILLKEDTYHRQVILKECEKNNFKPNIVLSSSQIETIRGLVASNAGISFLLDEIANKDNTIVSKPLEEALYIEIGLAWKQDKYLSKAAQAFIEFVKTHT